MIEIFEITNAGRSENIAGHETLVFDVICGDFNFDNMSPCDQVAGQNEIFSQYYDAPAVNTPGQDKVGLIESAAVSSVKI